LYPHERSLVTRLADQPFALLGVNSDGDRDALKETLKTEPITWRSWWDGSVDGPIHAQWQVTLRPGIHVLDVDGVIRYKDVTVDELDAAVDALLQEAAGRRNRAEK
jgi:hypothetical protein